MRGQLPAILTQIMGALPLFPLEYAASRLVVNALAARPSFASRLTDYSEKIFAIDPVDCPFAFLIEPRKDAPRVQLVRDLSGVPHDARIAAPMLVLLGMLDGTYDGDALFFSRDLVIDGDTEAVVALRNAIEDADLDPAGVLSLPKEVGVHFNRLTNSSLDLLRRVLGAPEPSGFRQKVGPA